MRVLLALPRADISNWCLFRVLISTWYKQAISIHSLQNGAMSYHGRIREWVLWVTVGNQFAHIERSPSPHNNDADQRLLSNADHWCKCHHRHDKWDVICQSNGNASSLQSHWSTRRIRDLDSDRFWHCKPFTCLTHDKHFIRYNQPSESDTHRWDKWHELITRLVTHSFH